MTFTNSTSHEFFLQICLTSLKWFLRNINVTEDFNNLGCFSISFERLILNAIVLLWIFNFPTICMNFSFSFEAFKILSLVKRNRDDALLFVQRICSYSFMMPTASLGFSTLSTRLFISTISTAVFIVMDRNSCFFTSSLSIRFVFLLVSEFLHS